MIVVSRLAAGAKLTTLKVNQVKYTAELENLSLTPSSRESVGTLLPGGLAAHCHGPPPALGSASTGPHSSCAAYSVILNRKVL